MEEWRKRYKLLAIPKVILPFEEQDLLLIDDKVLSRIKKDISSEYLEEIRAKQKISAKFGQHDYLDIDEQIKYEDEDLLRKKNLETKESALDIYQLDDKNSDFTMTNLHTKLEATEYKDGIV